MDKIRIVGDFQGRNYAQWMLEKEFPGTEVQLIQNYNTGPIIHSSIESRIPCIQNMLDPWLCRYRYRFDTRSGMTIYIGRYFQAYYPLVDTGGYYLRTVGNPRYRIMFFEQMIELSKHREDGRCSHFTHEDKIPVDRPVLGKNFSPACEWDSIMWADDVSLSWARGSVESHLRGIYDRHEA